MGILRVPDGEKPFAWYRKWHKRRWYKRMSTGQWLLFAFCSGSFITGVVGLVMGLR